MDDATHLAKIARTDKTALLPLSDALEEAGDRLGAARARAKAGLSRVVYQAAVRWEGKDYRISQEYQSAYAARHFLETLLCHGWMSYRRLKHTTDLPQLLWKDLKAEHCFIVALEVAPREVWRAPLMEKED